MAKVVFFYFTLHDIDAWFACMPKKISNLHVFSQPVSREEDEERLHMLIPRAWDSWNQNRPANSPARIRPEIVSFPRLIRDFL